MRDMVNICVMISSTTLLMIKVFAAVVALKWWILRALKPKHIHTYNMFSILHKSGVQSRQTIVKGMVTSKLHIWYVHGFSQFYIVIQSIIMLYMHVYIYMQYWWVTSSIVTVINMVTILEGMFFGRGFRSAFWVRWRRRQLNAQGWLWNDCAR